MILVRMKQMTALSAPQIPGWHKSVHHTRKYLWVCVYLSVYLTMFLSNDVDIALSRNGVIYIYIYILYTPITWHVHKEKVS